MKIGVLTFHRPANFGANLQAYSTVCNLSMLGHEVLVIDYVRDGEIEKYTKSVGILQYNAHKDFVEAHLPLTRRANTGADLIQIVCEEKFDAIVIGADAVWRCPQDDGIYFATWLLNSKETTSICVASLSAAHMGHGFSSLSESEKKIIRHCLEKFSYISVRDSWTKFVIEHDFFHGKEIIHSINPDPVTTLYKYINDFKWESGGLKSGEYYILSLPANWANHPKLGKRRRKWYTEFKNIVNRSSYKLVELPIPEGVSGFQFDYIVGSPLNPIQWFLWIKNAKGFCGLRFHAIVSSISNLTPFYSVDSYGDNSRKTMILDFLGLHKFARRGDKMSKIRNLLEGTGLEGNRTGAFLEFESPQKVFNLLKKCTPQRLLSVRNKYEEQFEMNLKTLLRSMKNGKS